MLDRRKLLVGAGHSPDIPLWLRAAPSEWQTTAAPEAGLVRRFGELLDQLVL